PPATQYGVYNQQLLAGPASGTETWTVMAGSLPPGLSLNASTGLLGGTPTSSGSFTLTVKATDQGSHQATAQFTLLVNTPGTGSGNPSQCFSALATTGLIRAEGTSEQLADLTFTCVGGGGTASMQVFLSPALAVTSKVLDASTGATTSATTGATEALAITSAGTTQGVVSGSTLTFTGIVIPAGNATVTV